MTTTFHRHVQIEVAGRGKHPRHRDETGEAGQITSRRRRSSSNTEVKRTSTAVHRSAQHDDTGEAAFMITSPASAENGWSA